MVAKEFQAVVFAAGHGSRLTDLVGNRPKCLIPVGRVPLIFYPLNLIVENGFTEAIVIVLETQKNEIVQRVEKLSLKLKCDFVTISSDSDYGTADSLRFISEKIKSDVLLISCDVMTNVDFHPVLNTFRKNDASVLSLFFNGSKGEGPGFVTPGTKSKHKQERDLVGIDSVNNRHLFLASTSDFESTMALPGHVLRSHGKIVIHSDLIDAHCYLVKKWVVDYLKKTDRFSTLKGELLPFIIKKQMSRPTNTYGYSEASLDIYDIFDHVKQNELDHKVIETNLNNLRIKKSRDSELIRCYAFIAPTTSIGMRVNTMMGFCLANKKILQEWNSFSNSSSISSNATIKSTQIFDSAVAENTTISEKTSIKNSIFGMNCFIHEKARIIDSVILNEVIIEEMVVLENCIICEKAIVKKGSVLKNCFVGFNHVVKEGTTANSSHLATTGFMEIE